MIFLFFHQRSILALENKICQSLDLLEKECEKLSRKDCQDLLEKCKRYYEKKAQEYQKIIAKTEAQERTFENQIAIYRNKISQLKSLISRNRLMIRNLAFQIEDTQFSIEKTSNKIEKTKEKLALLLQLIYEKDKKSLLEILLSGQTFGSFFENLQALEILQRETRENLIKIKNLHHYLESQKEKLAQEKETLERIVMLKRLQKEESERIKREKEELLRKTKGTKKLYQEYLEEVQKRAQEIRKRIFELAQIPEAKAPTLEEAFRLAKYVEDLVGVRSALLLGVLKAESAIGKNVGQCNCKGRPNCLHPELSYKDVMRKGQWPFFLKITQELGLDPSTTPVSCAINGGKVQWGGAMGPAQFMPATWMKYKERIEKFLPPQERPANPWRIKDAFLAAGLYLADWGAGSKRIEDEIGAVTAYLCGTSRMTSRCQRAGGKNYRYLVFKYASEFQRYIDEGILK